MKKVLKIILFTLGLILISIKDLNQESSVFFDEQKKEIIEEIREEIRTGIIPISNWQVASASYYDPMDSAQVGKKIPDGIGASGRLVGPGSIAMDSVFVVNVTNNFKDTVYVQINEVARYEREGETFYLKLNIKTPYGKVNNIFRSDDTMPKSKTILGDRADLCICDMDSVMKEIGRFIITYRVVKIKRGS
jgi:hypothetical protein